VRNSPRRISNETPRTTGWAWKALETLSNWRTVSDDAADMRAQCLAGGTQRRIGRAATPDWIAEAAAT
jgi:hypothetical protein